jgi:hypothetical protein
MLSVHYYRLVRLWNVIKTEVNRPPTLAAGMYFRTCAKRTMLRRPIRQGLTRCVLHSTTVTIRSKPEANHIASIVFEHKLSLASLDLNIIYILI